MARVFGYRGHGGEVGVQRAVLLPHAPAMIATLPACAGSKVFLTLRASVALARTPNLCYTSGE